MAQIAGETPPPERALIDENGVNVATGRYRQEHVDLALGSGAGALEFRRQYGETAYTTAFISSAYLPPAGSRFSVSVGSRSFGFVRTNSGFTSANGDGAQLTNSGDVFYLTESDGTRYTFGTIYVQDEDNNYNRQSYLSEIRSANGNILNVNWNIAEFRVCRDYYGCEADETLQNGRIERVIRLGSLSNSAGYAATLNYAGNHVFSQGDVTAWQTLTGVSGSNQHNGNDPVPSASISRDFQYAAGGYQQTDDVTDATGRTTRRTKMVSSNGSYDAVRLPGSTSDDVTVHQDGNQRVTYVQRAGGAAWFYQYAEPSAGVSTLLVTDPTGRTKRYVSDLSVGLPTRVEDGTGAATTYAYDGSGRLQSSTSPGGQVTSYSYDGRGNVATTTVTAAGGGATLFRSASYDPNCSGGINCGDPTSTTDQRGVVTSYTYDPTHGGVTSVTVQNPGGTSPSTQIRYGQVAGVWLPVRSWSCTTQASCENTGDAVQTSVAYDANLNPTTVTRGAGDGSLAATTTTSWSAAGDAIAVDGPLPGGGDVSRMAYDAARRPVAAMAPDPDGGGPRGIAASRTGYDAAGRVVSTERGTVPSGATDWSGFQTHQTSSIDYDGTGRKVAETLIAGGTAYARTGYGYDAAGRTLCVAVRMDPAQWFGQTDHCSPQLNGPNGPDRVMQFGYDPAGRQTQRQTAVGTASVALEQVSYTASGQVETVTDGEGNVTRARYDEFGRQDRLFYPSKDVKGQTSTTDWEGWTFDAGGRVSQQRLRDGQVYVPDYDGLGRVVQVQRWKLGVGVHDATGYGYDLFGRLLSASQQSTGVTTVRSYDALGRVLSDGQAWGAMQSGWDAAGRRVRLTWPDGTFVTYEYDAAGAMTAIRDGGGGLLASYGHDDLGRRVSLVRGNGATTAWAYDAAGRLSSLTQDIGGSAYDDVRTFTYNPAGQIASRTGSNDAYAYGGAMTVDRPYAVNGLNQYTTAGPASFEHDGRGNLTRSLSPGSDVSYAYDTDNRLTATAGVSLGYDPLDRMDRWMQGGLTRRLLRDLDGSVVGMVATNGTATSQVWRHVPGAGADEKLVWFYPEHPKSPIYYHQDERGSVVALSNGDGSGNGINRYDEWGNADAADGGGLYGFFGFTGQFYLHGADLYDYKARMYSARLGRFMQTDPIGYADGMNWYNYVGSDPVNSVDPTGLSCMLNGQELGENLTYEQCTERGGDYTTATITATRLSGGGNGAALTGGGSGGGVIDGGVGGGGAPGAEPAPQNIPCKEGVDCKVSWPKPLPPTCKAPLRCGPAPKPVPKKRLFGTHWCGPGGEGPTTGALDEACRAHDNCYGDNGLGVSSNFSLSPVPGLQQCNQALCDASQGQGTAGFLVRSYFRNAPMPANACRWDR